MKYVHENECEVKIKTFRDLLIDLKACKEAREWAKNKSIENVVEECEKIKWLCWLSNKLQIDKQLIVLSAGLIANQVRHLMKDKRSIRAVEAAISFGRGECSFDFLADAIKHSINAMSSYKNNPYKKENIRKAIDAAWAAASGNVSLAIHYTSMACYHNAYCEVGFEEAEIVRDYFIKCSLQIYKEICGDAIIKKVNEILTHHETIC